VPGGRLPVLLRESDTVMAAARVMITARAADEATRLAHRAVGRSGLLPLNGSRLGRGGCWPRWQVPVAQGGRADVLTGRFRRWARSVAVRRAR